MGCLPLPLHLIPPPSAPVPNTGATIHSVACDVADFDAVQRALTPNAADRLAIRGIVHSAGVLYDAPYSGRSVVHAADTGVT